jgi:hypothetical protein
VLGTGRGFFELKQAPPSPSTRTGTPMYALNLRVVCTHPLRFFFHDSFLLLTACNHTTTTTTMQGHGQRGSKLSGMFRGLRLQQRPPWTLLRWSHQGTVYSLYTPVSIVPCLPFCSDPPTHTHTRARALSFSLSLSLSLSLSHTHTHTHTHLSTCHTRAGHGKSFEDQGKRLLTKVCKLQHELRHVC